MENPPVALELMYFASSGCRRWESTCGRFIAGRDRYKARWFGWDRAVVGSYLRAPHIASAKTRAALEAKLTALRPTLPPKGRITFLRSDGSAYLTVEGNPDQNELSDLCFRVAGVKHMTLGRLGETLLPGTQFYVAWAVSRRADKDPVWWADVGTTPAEALEKGLDDLADPPGYTPIGVPAPATTVVSRTVTPAQFRAIYKTPSSDEGKGVTATP